MRLVWGVVLIVFTLLLCWLAQVLNACSPAFAARLGLAEPESDVDPTFNVDGRGEAIWDALILWTLPLAGILLLLGIPCWAHVGLVGGGMYLYFAGRGITVRWLMRQRDIPIGKPDTVRLHNVVLVAWGLIGLVTIILAMGELPLI